MRYVLVLGTLLVGGVLSMPARANDGAYVYRDGFYWSGANAYTRTLVTTPGSYYYSHGCYYQYPSTSYYSYTQMPVATKTEYQSVPAYQDGWKSEVLKYAAKKDDLAAYAATLKALGISYAPSYVAADATAFYQGGQTAYGYTYQSVKQAYGELDLNQLYQAAARLAQSSQQYGAEATANHASLVQDAGDNQGRIAEINARFQAMDKLTARIKELLDGPPSTKTTTTIQSNQPITPVPVTTNVEQVQAAIASSDPFVKNFAMPYCGKCHSGNNVKGNLNVAQWASFDAVKKASIKKRLKLPVTDKDHMPKADGGKASELPDEVLAQFLIH